MTIRVGIKMISLVALCAMSCMADVIPASAQSNGSAEQPGQRQKREDVAPNIEPLDRIESRVANRVQSRIRNRIDRFYDPQANTTSPYVVAADQNRRSGAFNR